MVIWRRGHGLEIESHLTAGDQTRDPCIQGELLIHYIKAAPTAVKNCANAQAGSLRTSLRIRTSLVWLLFTCKAGSVSRDVAELFVNVQKLKYTYKESYKKGDTIVFKISLPRLPDATYTCRAAN